MEEAEGMPHPLHRSREHQERRSRRKRRRTLIRSIYLLPSMATLGNAVCGFAAIYIASLFGQTSRDPWTLFFIEHSLPIGAYLIFLAMVFDALDGRLARFTRHTTDFGGQLDSMADVISFGVAPAILMLQASRSIGPWLFELYGVDLPFAVTRGIWAIGAVYVSCAAVRLARFNVSNQHGEQHHFSFLGLPSPAAGGAVAAWVLMCTALYEAYMERFDYGSGGAFLQYTYFYALVVLPLITLAVGLLMVSALRYPHIVNRYLRGRKSIATLVTMLIIAGVVLALHRYAIAIAMLIYVLWGITGYLMAKYRKPSSPAAVS